MDLLSYIHFIIFSAIFALFIMYLLFVSSISFGFVVSKLLSTFVMPKDTFIRINSFHMSFLSGKIVFKGLKMATKNTCIRVVEGQIVFRYWLRKARQSQYVYDSSPSRISIELSGLEYLVFNNSYKYDTIQEILKKKQHQQQQQQQQQNANSNCNSNNSSKINLNHILNNPINNNSLNDLNNIINNTNEQQQQSTSTDNNNLGGADTTTAPSPTSTTHEESKDHTSPDHSNSNEQSPPLPLVKDFVLPIFYRMFSAISITIRKGCVMLSNPELPTILLIVFDKCTGIYTTDAAHVIEFDYYRQIANMDLINTKMNLIPNKDYSGTEELYVDRPQKEDFVSYAFESFKSMYKDIKFTFINTDENFETSDLPKRTRDDDGGNGNGNGSGNGNGRVKQRESLFDYGKSETEILTCSMIHLNYYCDVAGPVLAGESHLQFKEFLSPQWGIEVNLNGSSTIVYGPWCDRNRVLIHKFFMPMDYETQKVYKPVIGEARPHACFKSVINFSKNTTFKIPFRELSKDIGSTNEELMLKKPGYVDIKLDELSSITCISPMIVWKQDGTNRMELSISLNKCSISTSLTNTQFLTCNKLKCLMDIDYPLVWNHHTVWNSRFEIESPQIFLLSDVLTLFKDLGNDWSAGEPVDITMFIPKTFTFDFALTNFKIYCNVNEQNIVNIPNNLQENAHYIFTGPQLSANLLLPFNSFQSLSTEITFDVNIYQLSLKLMLPVYNTIRQHLEDIELSDNDGSSVIPPPPPPPLMTPQTANINNNTTTTNISTNNYGSSQFIFCDEFSLNGKYLYYQKVDPSYLNSVVLNIVGKNPTVKLFGFYVRYFLFLKNNFFGYTSHIINLQKYKDNINKEEEGGNGKKNSNMAEEEDSNDLEIYVSVKLQDATLILPMGLYSSKQQATLALHEFLLEIRYLPTYLDLYTDFSPMVLKIPLIEQQQHQQLNDGGENELLNRFIQINDFTFKLHFLYGPKSSGLVNYADFINVHIGTITGNVLINQLTSLGIWFENFTFHLGNKDNALSTKLVSKISPVYSLLKLTINTVSLYIYSSEHITEIRLPQGLKMHSNSLIDQLSNSKTVIEFPEISFKHLIPFSKVNNNNSGNNQQSSSSTTPNINTSTRGGANSGNVNSGGNGIGKKNRKWAEVGELKIACNLSLYDKEPNWKIDSEKQRQFLELHDSESKFLAFLWQDDDEFEELYNQTIIEQQQLIKKHNVVGGNGHNGRIDERKDSFLFSPPNIGIGNSSTIGSNNGNGSSIGNTPISASKSNSFLYPIGNSNHILKWTTSSPMNAYDLFAANVGSGNNAVRNSKSALDISSSNYDDDDDDDSLDSISESNQQQLSNNDIDEENEIQDTESNYINDDEDDDEDDDDDDFQTPDTSLHTGNDDSSSDGDGENNKDEFADEKETVAPLGTTTGIRGSNRSNRSNRSNSIRSSSRRRSSIGLDESDKLYMTARSSQPFARKDSIYLSPINVSMNNSPMTPSNGNNGNGNGNNNNNYNFNNGNPLKVSSSTNNLKNILRGKGGDGSLSNSNNFGSNNELSNSGTINNLGGSNGNNHHGTTNNLGSSGGINYNSINPHIIYLRNYLRTYFFNLSQARMAAFGSNSKQSSFVECNTKKPNTTTTSNSTNNTSNTGGFGIGIESVNQNQNGDNPHESIHSVLNNHESSYINYLTSELKSSKIPIIPKRSKTKRLIIGKQESPQHHYDSIQEEDVQNQFPHDHKNENINCKSHNCLYGQDTTITTIFIDSMRDIELFATPVILNILEELVESFIAKDPSIDYMLDYFQLSTISEQFKVKKYLHNQLRLNIFIDKFNLNWIQSIIITPNKDIGVHGTSPTTPHTSRQQRSNSTTSSASNNNKNKGVKNTVELYTTEIQIESFILHLSSCTKQTGITSSSSHHHHHQMSLPQDEFCLLETKCKIKSIHGCVRYHNDIASTTSSPSPTTSTKHNHTTTTTTTTTSTTTTKTQSVEDEISYYSIPNKILSKYHSKSFNNQIIIASFSTESIRVKGVIMDEEDKSKLPSGDFNLKLGILSIYFTPNSPAILFRVVDTWIVNISALMSVFGRYKELWSRRMQTLIAELLKSKSRSLSNFSPMNNNSNIGMVNHGTTTSGAGGTIGTTGSGNSNSNIGGIGIGTGIGGVGSSFFGSILTNATTNTNATSTSTDKQLLDFISPDFKEIIGDEAIIHRSGWEDISKMRHFMKLSERPHIDQIVGSVSLNDDHDSYTFFQELINEIYETDQGGELIQLFQSPLIKKVFITEPGKNSKIDYNLQFCFQGFQLTVVSDNDKMSNLHNQSHNHGNSTPLKQQPIPTNLPTVNTTTNTTTAANTPFENTINQLAIGKVIGGAMANYKYESSFDSIPALSTKNLVPKSTLDIDFVTSCKQVSLKISPDLISFIQNTIKVVEISEVDVLKGEELILGSHDPWKEAVKPSTSREFGSIRSPPPTSPPPPQPSEPVDQQPTIEEYEDSTGNNGIPMINLQTSGNGGGKHSKGESSPNLSSITKNAKLIQQQQQMERSIIQEQQQQQQHDFGSSMSGVLTSKKVYYSAANQQQRKLQKLQQQQQSNFIITAHGHFSFEEIHCRAFSTNNGTLRMVLKNLSFVFNEFGDGSTGNSNGGSNNNSASGSGNNQNNNGETPSKPNGDIIQMIHSCIFSIPSIELHLLDHHSTDAMKPIFGLSVKNLSFNEVLFKVGKKKTRQIVSTGKREEYIDFSLKYDLFLTFSQAILPFKMSHQFLPKLRGFLKEWTPVSEKKVQQSTSNQPIVLSDIKFPPIRIKLDLYDIMISTDAISYLPVKYNISRITASASQFSHYDFEFNVQLHQHQITFVKALSQSTTSTNSTGQTTTSGNSTGANNNIGLTKEPFNFPRIKSFGSIKNKPSKDRIDLMANLEIGYIQNILSIDLLQNILVLRATLSKEIDELLNAYISFAEKKSTDDFDISNGPADVHQKPPPSILSKIKYNCNLILRGFELLFANSSASLLFSSGVIDVRVIYHQLQQQVPSQPMLLSASSQLPPILNRSTRNIPAVVANKTNNRLNSLASVQQQIQQQQNETLLTWKIGFRDLSMILSDPTLTLNGDLKHHGYSRIQNMKSQIWAGITTDISLQSYPFNKLNYGGGSNSNLHGGGNGNSNNGKGSSFNLVGGGNKSSIFEKAWVLINKTMITLQPWAIDKATDLWIYYFNSYQKTVSKLAKISNTKRKQQVSRALNTIPSTIPIKETNLSLHIKIIDTNICIPLLLSDSPVIVVPQPNNKHNHHSNSNKNNNNQQHQIDTCSALAISLGTFSLYGVAIKNLQDIKKLQITTTTIPTNSTKKPTTPLKSKSNTASGGSNTPVIVDDEKLIKVLGNCKFSKFSFQFVDNYHPSKLNSLQLLPSINRGIIDSGDCAVTGLFSSHNVQLFVNLNTTGLFLHLDTNLMFYIVQFQDLLFLGQEKIKKINLEEQQKLKDQQQTSSIISPIINGTNSSSNKKSSSSTGSTTPTITTTSSTPEYRLEIDFTLKTSIGEAILTKASNGNDDDNNPPSLYSSFDKGSNHNGGSPFSNSANGRNGYQNNHEQFQECFQIPQISISANHILIPKENHNPTSNSSNSSSSNSGGNNSTSTNNTGSINGKTKSETNILLVLESHEIKLTPLFTNFLSEIVKNTPESSMSHQYSQEADGSNIGNINGGNGGDELVKTTPGSTTFTIRINPTKFYLNGFDSTLAILEIGTLDIFLSNIIKNTTSSSSKRVLLMNGTLYLSSLLLKIVHSSLPDERLGIVIKSVKGNVGIAHGITTSPLISILLNGDNSHGYFNVKFLDEVLQFINQWIPNSSDNNEPVIEKNIHVSPIPIRKSIDGKSTTNTTTNSTTSGSVKKIKSQFYINIKMGSFGLDLDFLPISRFNLLINNIGGIYSPSSEIEEYQSNLKRMYNDPNEYTNKTNDLFFLTCYTGPISISGHGKLQGDFELGGIILCGERKLYQQINYVNMWTFQIAPIKISFDFNQSEILDLQSGEFTVRFSDLPIDNQPNQRNINCEISYSMLQLLLSCETITSILDIIKRIHEIISDKIKSAKSNIIHSNVNNNLFKSTSKIVTTSTTESTIAAAQPPLVKSKISIGQIKFKGLDFRVLLFGYSFKDPTWFSFSLESYQVVLDQSRKKNDEIHRQISILLGQSFISKMTENNHNSGNGKNNNGNHNGGDSNGNNGNNSGGTNINNNNSDEKDWDIRDHFSRPASETKIIKIPVSSLIMYSTERSNSAVEYYYLTEFTDSIAISVNLGLYADLREMIQIYIKVLTDATALSSGSGKTPTHSPTNNHNNGGGPIGLSNSQVIHHGGHHGGKSLVHSGDDNIDQHHLPFDDNASQTSSSTTIRYGPNTKTRKDLKTGRIFVEKKFQLSPTLNVLGEFTPKITTVFGWLGIKDINYTIPFYTHIGLTDNLETLLNQFLSFSNTLNVKNNNQHHQQQQPKQNINNNNNNNNNNIKK